MTIMHLLVSYLDLYGGTNHSSGNNLSQCKGQLARECFISIISKIIDETKQYFICIEPITQWQNSGFITKYFWGQIKKINIANSSISLSLFVEKHLSLPRPRFRLSAEINNSKANAEEIKAFRKILGKDLNENLIYVNGGNDEKENFRDLPKVKYLNETQQKQGKIQVSYIIKEEELNNYDSFFRSVFKGLSLLLPYYETCFDNYDNNLLQHLKKLSQKKHFNFNFALSKELTDKSVEVITNNFSKEYITKISQSQTDNLIEYLSQAKCKKLDSEELPQQKIYFGEPGSGKSNTVRKLEKKDNTFVFRTTFHPDTGYENFVGTYKPQSNNDNITYSFVPQIFSKTYVEAWNNLCNDKKYYLVIEEINRGNCAQIFGDIFQLLDRNKYGFSEYHIEPDIELTNYINENLDIKYINLKNNWLNTENYNENENKEKTEDIIRIRRIQSDIKHGKKLCLPPNLSIIATMNTSDQSLFPMDSAFKRRWDWEYVPSEDNDDNDFIIMLGDENDNNLAYKWHSFRKAINDKIKETTDSEDKQLGSFFIKSDVNKEQFKAKVMFYLWSEVFKEEYHTGKNHFRSNITPKNQQDKDNPKEEYHEFTFNELYEKNDIEMLAGFMKYLKVKTKAEEDSEKKEKKH